MSCKRRGWALLALSLHAGLVAGDEFHEIKQRGRLRVGIWVNGIQEFFSVTGEPAPGFDRELLEGFAALHKLQLQPVSLQTLEDLLGSLERPADESAQPAVDKEGGGASPRRPESVDLIAGGITATDARRKRVDFTTEVFPTRHVVVTRRPQPPVESLDQLRALRVGTVLGTSWAERIADLHLPPGRVQEFPDLPSLRQGLRDGQVSAIVLATGTAMLEQRDDPAVQLGLFFGPPQAVGWAVRKGHGGLRAALNDYIGNVRRSGAWNRLLVKYWGASAPDVLRKARAE